MTAAFGRGDSVHGGDMDTVSSWPLISDTALRQPGPLPPAGFWEAKRLKVITKKVEKWCVTLLVGSLFYILWVLLE